jgi:hypothetical protein
MLVEEPAYERRPYWNGVSRIDQEVTVASKWRERLTAEAAKEYRSPERL